jgi:predicted nuclease of predicted toxin-antitoxin system
VWALWLSQGEAQTLKRRLDTHMSWVNIEDMIAANPPKSWEVREVQSNLAKHAKARFLVDENFPPKAIAILRAMRAKVVTARDAGLMGYGDEAYVAYALRHGLMLVTCDRDFLDERRHPLIHCPAIFVFNFGACSAPEIRLAFRCLGSVLSMPQFFNKGWKIDAARDTWIEYVRYQDGSTGRYRFRLLRGQLQEWVNDAPADGRT